MYFRTKITKYSLTYPLPVSPLPLSSFSPPLPSFGECVVVHAVPWLIKENRVSQETHSEGHLALYQEPVFESQRG